MKTHARDTDNHTCCIGTGDGREEGGLGQEQRGGERDMDEEQGKLDLSQLYHYLLAKRDHYLLAKRESSEVLGFSSLSKTQTQQKSEPDALESLGNDTVESHRIRQWKV